MRLALLCLLLAAPLLPRSAEAASIAVTPPGQLVSVGDSFSVTLEASDLAGEAIGGFDLDVSFDATRFAFVSALFGGALGDVGAGDQLTDVVTGTGLVSLGSVSLLDPTELASLQTGTVSLVTLTFEAVALGAGAFAVEAAQLAYAFGAELAIGSVAPATVDVPEPGLAWLLGLGGAAALVRRRR
jgi:hypothetical protein